MQTNLAGPGPSLGLALKDTTGRLINSSFQQQSNLQPLAWRPQGRAQEFAIQQSNLSIRETSVAECGRHTSPCLWLEPQESWPNLRPWGSPLSQGPLDRPSSSLRRSRLLATDTRCPDVRPTAGLAPLNWHTQPGLRSRCGLGGSTSRIVGEPLSLEDLAVSAWSRAWAPSQAAIHQLLASVRRLEHEAARFRCQASREPPGPVQREPWTSAGQAVPAHPQPSQPVLASCNERKKHSGDLRETVGFPETPGVQDGLSDSQASSKPARMETTLQMLPGDALDPEQGVLGAHRLRRGKKSSPGTTYGRGRRGDPLLSQGVGSREASLCSLVSCSSAWDVLPGQEGGEGTPWEQISKEGERLASCPPDMAPTRTALQVETRRVWEWELGPQGLGGLPPPGNSHSKLAVTALSHSLRKGGHAGRLGRGRPVLLASRPESCIMFLCFPRTNSETLEAWSLRLPGEAMGWGMGTGATLLGQLLSQLPGD